VALYSEGSENRENIFAWKLGLDLLELISSGKMSERTGLFEQFLTSELFDAKGSPQ
jgi:hypothetical protein